MTKTSEIKEFNDLPKNAKSYIEKIEELCNVKASIISNGAGREQTIIRDNYLVDVK